MSYDKVCCVGHGRFKRLFFQFSNLPNKQFIDITIFSLNLIFMIFQLFIDWRHINNLINVK